MSILVEITGAVDALGTLQTFYVSSTPYQTKPSDTPASVNFVSALQDPGSLGVNVYGNGRTAGYGALQTGQLKLANNDGRFDAWMRYGFDGRPVVIRLFIAGIPYASMPIIFTGTVDGPPELTRQNMSLRLKDKQVVLEVPALPNLYGGTNTLPNGIDGTPNDLKGRRKARVYGSVLNISPDCVNTSLLIYQVNDGPVAAVSAAYDSGAPFTVGGDHPNSAALSAATIASGSFHTCLAEGLFRINSAPGGQVTADVVQGASAANRTAARVIEQIALAALLAPAEISHDDILALDIAQPAVVGIQITGDTNARDAISQVAASIGAFAVFDTSGVLRMGILTDPAGTPVFSITDSQALSLERQAQTDGDVPVFSVTLSHTQNWTVQTTGVTGSVSAARRAFLASQWLSTNATDASIKLRYLLSADFPVTSLLYDPTNLDGGPAHIEALRQLSLYKVQRDIFEVTVHIDVLRSQGVPSLMSLISIRSPRFNLSAGKLFWMIGFTIDLKRSQAVLVCWG